MKQVRIYGKLKQNSKYLIQTEFYLNNFFKQWIKLALTFNFINGKEYKIYKFKLKKRSRFTYSGSPHTQTKKGRDFLEYSSYNLFGVKILNSNPILLELFYCFIKNYIIKYKSLQTGLSLKIKYI